jgi:hypothetical protein
MEVMVVSECQSEVDAQLFARIGGEYASVELKLYTGVEHLAGVEKQVLEARGDVECYVGEDVGAVFAVCVDRTVEAVAEESEVKTPVAVFSQRSWSLGASCISPMMPPLKRLVERLAVMTDLALELMFPVRP